MELDAVTSKVLAAIDAGGFQQEGAYNLRYNGQALCHGDSEHIKIKKKEGKPGIDVFISSGAQGEQVHIPVVISKSGMSDIVYNDFYIVLYSPYFLPLHCPNHSLSQNRDRLLHLARVFPFLTFYEINVQSYNLLPHLGLL